MTFGTSVKKNINLRWLAIICIILYAIVRAIFVWATLESYGVNPWIFLLIDASTGVTYVLGIEQLLRSLGSRQEKTLGFVFAWSIVAVLSFAAPYAYLFWAGQQMPSAFTIGIGIVVLLLFANATLNIYRRIHKK